MVSSVEGGTGAGLQVTEQPAWLGKSLGAGPIVQLDAGWKLPGAGECEVPMKAMKVTEPVGAKPFELVTVAVHTVLGPSPVPGPKIVGLQLTVVIVGGWA